MEKKYKKTPAYIFERCKKESKQYNAIELQLKEIRYKIVCLYGHLSDDYERFSGPVTLAKDNLINEKISKLREEEDFLVSKLSKYQKLWIAREERYYDF